MKVEIKSIGKMIGAQDGAIHGDYLFRFRSKGYGYVYDLRTLGEEYTELVPIAEFQLDKSDIIAPHSNAVVFGNEKYDEADEFPLLYSNIYNNYRKEEDQLVGVTCVYRIMREGDGFTSKLVQLIEIGFTDDRVLWRSAGDVADERPFGNFVIDRERGLYIGFVMRDADKTTRYFAFDLPKLADGEPDATYGVNRVKLMPSDIKWHFDTPYHNFIQGAICKDGIVYSVEGFNSKIHPGIRVIDTDKRCQLLYEDFYLAFEGREAEFIDFYQGRCIYGDAYGELYELIFS